MTVTVYVDILFVLNFFIDGILLLLCALLSGLPIRPFRLGTSALLGAVYATATVFIPFLSGILFSLSVAALMVFWSFRPRTRVLFARQLATFYIVSLSLYGLCLFIFMMLPGQKRASVFLAQDALFFNIHAGILFSSVGLLFLLMKLVFRTAKKAQHARQSVQKITLSYEGKQKTLPALYDTGNFVRDSRGSGVCIADWEGISPLFSGKSGRDAAIFSAKNIRFFTCSGIGREETLPAFLMTLSVGKQTPEIKRWVAVTNKILDQSGRYHLLLPNDFEGANQYGDTVH